MKTTLFLLAVISAAVYLGYSQSPEVKHWLQEHMQSYAASAANQAREMTKTTRRLAERGKTGTEKAGEQQARINLLEAEVERLHAQLSYLASHRGGSALIEDITVDDQRDAFWNVMPPAQPGVRTVPTGLSPAERSKALIQLAQRMELKAIGY